MDSLYHIFLHLSWEETRIREVCWSWYRAHHLSLKERFRQEGIEFLEVEELGRWLFYLGRENYYYDLARKIALTKGLTPYLREEWHKQTTPHLFTRITTTLKDYLSSHGGIGGKLVVETCHKPPDERRKYLSVQTKEEFCVLSPALVKPIVNVYYEACGCGRKSCSVVSKTIGERCVEREVVFSVDSPIISLVTLTEIVDYERSVDIDYVELDRLNSWKRYARKLGCRYLHYHSPSRRIRIIR